MKPTAASAAVLTAADLRAELARARVPAYQVAARIGVHPVTLGGVLNERQELTQQMAEKIFRAIKELEPTIRPPVAPKFFRKFAKR